MTPPPTHDLDVAVLWSAALVEFIGGLVVVAACLRAVLTLASALGSRQGVTAARLAVAEGVVAALGFKTAATLLKTLELRSWRAIATFAAILALRTLVKAALTHETRRLRREVASE